MKKWMAVILTLCFIALPLRAFADVVEGDSIITLGENLTEQQKQDILKEFNAPKNTKIVTVSNAEEHKYLGESIPSAQIGSRAISSAMITYGKKGTGVVVKSNNINGITDNMYATALITAGLKDATVHITAPFTVSGTAALTGIMKAYQVSTDKKIDDAVIKVANKEMVETEKLGQAIGNDQAVHLISEVKKEIANNTPKTEADVQALVEQTAKDLNTTLTPEQQASLTSLFNEMKNTNIDWGSVQDQLNNVKDKFTNYIASEEGQSFLEKVKTFFVSILDAIKSLFN